MSARDLFAELMDEEFLNFDQIESPLSHLADLTAFLMLAPYAKGDIIGWSEHDEYGLNVDVDRLDGLPVEFIKDLLRCGVMYSAEYDSLTLFA